jgi:ABC-type multidrug transport system ATPase subunit
MTDLSTVLDAQGIAFGYPQRPLFTDWSARIAPGVTLVRGGDGRGKTTLLRLLAGAQTAQAGQLRLQAGGHSTALDQAPAAYRQQVFWVDPRDDGGDQLTPDDCFALIAQRHPGFQAELIDDLVEGLALAEHRAKRLFMLSTGSRRKVWLAAAFASGAAVTLLDDPFAALDKPSIRFVTELLQEAAGHSSRGWVVTGYAVPDGVTLAATIDLGD